MKKKTLKVIVTLSLITAAAVGINSKITKEDTSFSLLIDQIEASANAAGETTTSWRCVGSSKKCEATCGECGTTVNGKGNLTGSHSCN